MLRLQRLTGMRPGELCAMRPADIDRADNVWKYTPIAHKTEHHARSRVVHLGPRAQAIIAKYLDRHPESHCFSPAQAETARNSKRSDDRITPLWPSHRRRNLSKRKACRSRGPGKSYSTMTYARAIERACTKAYPPPDVLVRCEDESLAEWQKRLGSQGIAELHAWRKGHRFHPHQVRHRAAAEFREKFGLETARALLGHSFAAVSDHYSIAADGKLSSAAAAAIG